MSIADLYLWVKALHAAAALMFVGGVLAGSVFLAGHWFVNLWLQAKLVFVVILSGLHGIQSGRLRKLAGGIAVRALRTSYVVLTCVVGIAVLAVLKPG